MQHMITIPLWQLLALVAFSSFAGLPMAAAIALIYSLRKPS